MYAYASKHPSLTPITSALTFSLILCFSNPYLPEGGFFRKACSSYRIRLVKLKSYIKSIYLRICCRLARWHGNSPMAGIFPNLPIANGGLSTPPFFYFIPVLGYWYFLLTCCALLLPLKLNIGFAVHYFYL